MSVRHQGQLQCIIALRAGDIEHELELIPGLRNTHERNDRVKVLSQRLGSKREKPHSEDFLTAVPQKAEVVLHRGERQLSLLLLQKRRSMFEQCLVTVSQAQQPSRPGLFPRFALPTYGGPPSIRKSCLTQGNAPPDSRRHTRCALTRFPPSTDREWDSSVDA